MNSWIFTPDSHEILRDLAARWFPSQLKYLWSRGSTQCHGSRWHDQNICHSWPTLKMLDVFVFHLSNYAKVFYLSQRWDFCRLFHVSLKDLWFNSTGFLVFECCLIDRLIDWWLINKTLIVNDLVKVTKQRWMQSWTVWFTVFLTDVICY